LGGGWTSYARDTARHIVEPKAAFGINGFSSSQRKTMLPVSRSCRKRCLKGARCCFRACCNGAVCWSRACASPLRAIAPSLPPACPYPGIHRPTCDPKSARRRCKGAWKLWQTRGSAAPNRHRYPCAAGRCKSAARVAPCDSQPPRYAHRFAPGWRPAVC
jgi:hypothetical protein